MKIVKIDVINSRQEIRTFRTASGIEMHDLVCNGCQNYFSGRCADGRNLARPLVIRNCGAVRSDRQEATA